VIVRALLRLLALAALAAAGWWLGRRLGGTRRDDAGRRTAPPPSRDAMVRDRVCNTFLPRSRALEARVGGQTHFFCSEACRSRFLESSNSARGA
jgi:uncharacterized protein